MYQGVRVMADSIKCPNCGSNLTFNIEKQKAVCEYCLNEFSADQLSNFLDTDEKPNERPKFQKVSFKKKKEALFADGVKFTCNSCGARLVTDKQSIVTYCSYCGSPALISERLSEEFAPDYIIPFKIDKDEAIKLFTKWCDGGKWTPCDYVSDDTKAKITGIYVPFWLYDTEAKIDVSGKGYDRDSEGNKQRYDVGRKMDVTWENIPVMASPNFNEELMETIEPYELEDMSDFHPAYLQGFLAECYAEDANSLKGRASRRIKEYVDEEVANSLLGRYDKAKIDSDCSSWKHTDTHYGLFPVWYLHYEHKGKSYDVAINGQTGKISGHYPISKMKRLMVLFTIFIFISIAIRLFLGAIWGGLIK